MARVPFVRHTDELVGESLEDCPAEESNRELLMGHAPATGEVMPLWGHRVGFDGSLWQ